MLRTKINVTINFLQPSVSGFCPRVLRENCTLDFFFKGAVTKRKL